MNSSLPRKSPTRSTVRDRSFWYLFTSKYQELCLTGPQRDNVAYQFSNLDESTSDMVRPSVSFRKKNTKARPLQRYENQQGLSYRCSVLIRIEKKMRGGKMKRGLCWRKREGKRKGRQSKQEGLTGVHIRTEIFVQQANNTSTSQQGKERFVFQSFHF